MNNKKIKNVVLIIFVVLTIIFVFTFIDYVIHQLSEKYVVPSRYFTNKIIYGTIIGLVTYYFIRNKKPLIKSFIFSGILSVLLQVRYFLEGYPTDFVILFLLIHFVILLPISYVAFKILNRLNLKKQKWRKYI